MNLAAGEDFLLFKGALRCFEDEDAFGTDDNSFVCNSFAYVE